MCVCACVRVSLLQDLYNLEEMPTLVPPSGGSRKALSSASANEIHIAKYVKQFNVVKAVVRQQRINMGHHARGFSSTGGRQQLPHDSKISAALALGRSSPHFFPIPFPILFCQEPSRFLSHSSMFLPLPI